MGFSFKLAIKRDYRQVAVAELMLAFFDADNLVETYRKLVRT
jgi:hypothetical protein